MDDFYRLPPNFSLGLWMRAVEAGVFFKINNEGAIEIIIENL